MDYRTSVLHEIENIETELDFINTLLKKRRAIELDDIEIRAAALAYATAAPIPPPLIAAAGCR